MTLEIEPQLLKRARGYHRRSVEELLEAIYPSVHRLAHGLCGRADVARPVLRFVVRRGIEILGRWEDEGAPLRWFHHHTVLAARRSAEGHEPDPQADLLVRRGDEPAYLAFVRALRALPMQQREAFILHHGERLNIRRTGVAMDCSHEAAATHLNAATDALKAVSGEQFDPFTSRMAEIYAQLTPPRNVIVPFVRGEVRRHIWPRRIKRVLIALFILALLAASIWSAWWWFGL